MILYFYSFIVNSFLHFCKKIFAFLQVSVILYISIMKICDVIEWRMFMKLGDRIKKIRKQKKISAEDLAKLLNVSVSTVYRYENSSIEKIPVQVFEKIAKALDISTAELMGNVQTAATELPNDFTDAQSAIEFILKMPTLAAYGGYDPDSMSEETIIEFANEMLGQLKLVSYKYKR